MVKTLKGRMAERKRVANWRTRNPNYAKEYNLKHIAREKERRDNLKKEIMTHYGNGKCACVRCGESRLACLSIDHINGGGNKQRKGSLRSPYGFYRWLKKGSYPEGFQTLCMNCQFVKRFVNHEHH